MEKCGGAVGKCVGGRWGVWKNVGEVWESVLGCRGSSIKRGVGEVRRGGGVKKCGGGVRKCVGVWGEGVKKWKEWENTGECVGKRFGC